MEDALGDAREHIDHRVHPFLLRNVRELQHTQPIAEELTVEEPIHQVHLKEDVDETQGLASEVAVNVHVVSLKEQAITELA